MVQFNTLRLNGFKSFADRTEIDIGKGLTGVVGPNGCGKSNLVEALRWVMGESSSRRMRGGASMEDVIFSGTSTRSSRNFAEVSLVLDNRGRTAPAEFNNSDEIEVVRRIERDKGSLYKINGKTVRARDVQMLFADIVVEAGIPPGVINIVPGSGASGSALADHPDVDKVLFLTKTSTYMYNKIKK